MGLMAWEGHARQTKDPARRRVVSENAIKLLTHTAALCREAGMPVSIVSCGGTGTERFSSHVPGVTEIQAGGIIFNDMYYSSLGLDYEHALKVISTITSRPSDTRIVTDAGRKTMSSDSAAPHPIGIHEVKSVSLSAEHGCLELERPNLDLKVGNKVEWIVGYGDTTVCLHDVMYGVREGIVEAVWPILARGKVR
jgi:D-serine deaminase-like pyridoxal phosphate-dependent protein